MIQTDNGGDMMYFYQVLQSCDEFKVVSEFLAMIKSSEKCSANQRIRETIKVLPQITPNKSDNEVLYIEELKEAQEEGENYYNVYLLDRSNNETYSIEAVPWDEVLGYTVDEASIAKYGDVKFTALVLYEMTYFGFSEKQIQNTIKAFNDEDIFYSRAYLENVCKEINYITEKDIDKMYDLAQTIVRDLMIYHTSRYLHNVPLLVSLCRRDVMITEVEEYSCAEILEATEQINDIAVRLFRDGRLIFHHGVPAVYAAAQSVCDEYLLKIFARAVRSEMMVYAGVRIHEADEHYLVFRENNGSKEWLGVYWNKERFGKDIIAYTTAPNYAQDISFCSL